MSDQHTSIILDTQIELTVTHLRQRQFAATVVNEAKDAVDLIESLIPKQASVGFGGSQTLYETGIIDKLCQMEINLLDRDRPGLSRPERNEILRQQLMSDYYLCSSNAVSMAGKLYNVDGNGNRTAAMIFGPKQVLVVVGANKIVKDEAAAIERINTIAAPANCARLNRDTPCVKTGFCTDCQVAQRICAAYVRLDRSMTEKRIHVIIIRHGQWGY